MSGSKLPKSHPRRLVVENRDAHAIIHLMKRHGADWDGPDMRLPYVHSAGDDVRALNEAALAVKATYSHVGVVIDADTDATARWAALRDRWRKVGVEVPDELRAGGWVGQQAEGRRFGAWIMPDNRSVGALEVFLHTLVPAGDPRWPLAEESTRQARELGPPGRRAPPDDKARLYAWLAWQENPGRPPGTAIHARFLTHDSALALEFVAWFREMYELATS